MLGTFTKGDPEAEAIEERWEKEKRECLERYNKAVEVLEIYQRTKSRPAAERAIRSYKGDQRKLRDRINELRGKQNAE